MPRFTVVIPCQNAEATLGDMLDSLVGQSFENWNALVIDDGSWDGTRCVAWDYAARDRRIGLAGSHNRGMATALNLARNLANGELLAFCLPQDIWAPHKLARMDVLFRDPAVDAAFGRVGVLGGLGTLSAPLPAGDRGVQLLSLPQLLDAPVNPVVTLSNLTLRRGLFQDSGGFDETLRQQADLEYLVRLVAAGHRIHGLEDVLVHIRPEPTPPGEDLEALHRGRQAALRIARDHGYRPARKREAALLCALADKALHSDTPALQALRLALSGLLTSPKGFLPAGGPTLAAALLAPLMPRRLRRALFAH
ncbi:glycosyltransferase [Pseudooceanicola sp. CBS1P-1]|uniref:Glycosyltransferase n=1 Tax=Pseudooceanicola albus TaxID=2692189 RepID=A0A6L7G525_9RHOB|nr:MULTISPECIES: glycosyltransferase family A protein [Pseudooceanicola]MBT9383037.1 glycosyltransferase [Pseudooceanicola endophyticus]MXN19225.1 glycosyltransferase [Pseudooceanicola albus]